ncbi:MAG: aminodeoxychorismate/anthranilate synthase component II [Candidatus Helarchaeota archaeon]|nr:aminodeoxychorismate/anthranilate synthase component II [Candidatus Helarchaeota archaeon]
MNKVLFINNNDSFVYIIVDYFLQNDCNVIVVNNEITIKEFKEIKPDRIVISPGPGHPRTDTGNVIPIIEKYYSKIPIFGVCLGLQAIVETMGGEVDRARVGPIHGELAKIYHDGKTIFKDLPKPFEATRYHSLAAWEESLPDSLEISAKAEDGTIMGVRHKKYKMEGVQFHPESILTIPHGMKIIQNFLNL